MMFRRLFYVTAAAGPLQDISGRGTTRQCCVEMFKAQKKNIFLNFLLAKGRYRHVNATVALGPLFFTILPNKILYSDIFNRSHINTVRTMAVV